MHTGSGRTCAGGVRELRGKASGEGEGERPVAVPSLLPSLPPSRGGGYKV